MPGFRPGKAPRAMLERALGVQRGVPGGDDPIYDDAREHLYERSVIEALRDSDVDALEIPREPEWTSFSEADGASYRVTLPVRPTVKLGDYKNFPFKPEVDEPDDPKVEQVLEQLRDQQASLVAVEDRPAQKGDFAVISFEGRLDGEPVEGAASERLPLIIGNERMIPGFEDQLIGMAEDEDKTFSVRFPDEYGEEALAGREVEFTARIRELRERRLPPADVSLASSVGSFETLAELRDDIRTRLGRSARDRARHAFADRIIEYASANATVEVPDMLVDREVEVMLDELKVRLGEQGIGYEEYLKATDRDESKLREEYREPAEHRVKVLLTLAAVADAEGVSVPDEAVEAEIERSRAAAAQEPGADSRSGSRLVTYLESDRGRSYIRSQLRRSQTVEGLIDGWIAAHPEFSHVQHVEDQPALESAKAAARATEDAPEASETAAEADASVADASVADAPVADASESETTAVVPQGVPS
ncbi:MAG: trigger factor [Chloroflexota bacterium]|nr:trigger factor [Chloroflexota bacterium]